jgi:hypothetical protein
MPNSTLGSTRSVSGADGSRQKEDKPSRVVALQPDFSMVPLPQVVDATRWSTAHAVAHHRRCSTSASSTFRAIRKRPCSIRSSPSNWKHFSAGNKSVTIRSRDSSKKNSGRSWPAAFWREGRSFHTKYYLENLPERVEVTRRHHPLFGRELEVIRANKVMLTIRLHDGSTMKVLRAWTNAGRATRVVEPPRCSVLSNEGVRGLIDLVSAMRRRD